MTQNVDTTRKPDSFDLEAEVLDAIEGLGGLEWDEMVAALPDSVSKADLGAVLKLLEERGRISRRGGEYVIDGSDARERGQKKGDHSPAEMREMADTVRDMGFDALADHLDDGADEIQAKTTTEPTDGPTHQRTIELASTVRDEGFGALADWLEDNAHVLPDDDEVELADE